MKVFRGIKSSGIAACFDEPNTTGVWNDINAARNAPMKTPGNYLDKIDFHSRFNYHVAASGWPKTVTINHIAYAADAGTSYGILTVYKAHSTYDYKIADHGLGAVPPEWFVSTVINGVRQVFPLGCPIQLGPNGGGRRSISFWCDTTSLWVHEDVKPGVLGLPAISVTYYALVCRPTTDQAGQSLFSGNASTGFTQMGRGRIRSDNNILRNAQSGDSNIFSIPTTAPAGWHNGKVRFALLDMNTFDLGPIMGKHTYDGGFWGGAQKEVALSG